MPPNDAINVMWTLLAAFLVMFMQAGFALVETGMTRAKNVAHTMAMNLMVFGIGSLGFYLLGFGLMFGGYHAEATGAAQFGSEPSLFSEFKIAGFGLFGTQGFLLAGTTNGVLVLFLFHVFFMDTAATIPTGSLAERWKFVAFAIYVLVVSALIYPIFGNWVWGGGWLSKLGVDFGLGHGLVDFAGSSVVHMTGGTLALAGVLVVGPRLGKYNADGSVNALPAHNVPMYMVGTFILAFGWFGFNAGSTLAGTDANIGRIAVNTLLAAAAGAVASMLAMWRWVGKPDPSFLCNGMLAGLVAITAPCAFVAPSAAVLIGAAAGLLVIGACLFFEKIAKIDDPVGAISVHGVCGIWGVLALGLFADGSYGQGWNGVPGGVAGLFYGDGRQLLAQLVGAIANLVFVFAAGYALFNILEKTFGNRVSAEAEAQGLDIAEMGIVGYINEDPKIPEGHLTSSGREPRAARAPADGHKRFVIVVDGLSPERIAALWSELCRPNAGTTAEFRTLYRQFTILDGNRFRFISGDPDELRELLTTVLCAADGGDANLRTQIEPAAERTPLWS